MNRNELEEKIQAEVINVRVLTKKIQVARNLREEAKSIETESVIELTGQWYRIKKLLNEVELKLYSLEQD